MSEKKNGVSHSISVTRWLQPRVSISPITRHVPELPLIPSSHVGIADTWEVTFIPDVHVRARQHVTLALRVGVEANPEKQASNEAVLCLSQSALAPALGL